MDRTKDPARVPRNFLPACHPSSIFLQVTSKIEALFEDILRRDE